MRFNNPRHARQHSLHTRACENHSQDFENILTREVFRQCAIRLGIVCADRLGGTMVCGRHPRIIVPLAIPSLLKPMASGRALSGLLVQPSRRPCSTLANYHAAVATYCQTSPTKG